MLSKENRELYLVWLCLFLIVLPNISFSQSDPIIAKSDDKLVKIFRRKEPRPKILEFDYTYLPDVHVDGTSETLGNSSADIKSNIRASLKVKIPFILKPNFKLLGGYNFSTEIFTFRDAQGMHASYYNDLNGRSLTSTSVSMFMKKNFTKDKFLYGFLNAGLHSDKIAFSETTDQFKSNIAFIYVKNTSPISQMGYGGGFGYIFGGPIIFPIMIINRTFSEHWNLEALLPQAINFRYTFSDEMYLIFINEINGGSYFLRNPTVEGFDRVTLQRSAFIPRLRFEREIYDFIWFGLDFGYNVPINLYLGEPRKSKSDAVVMFDNSPSFIFNFSFFLVVPKKILYKASKPR